MPQLSFVILTYNSSKYIQELLESLLQEIGEVLTNGTCEVVIFDNNSSDDTVKLVQKFEQKGIRVFQSATNLGYAKGINKAVKEVKSPLFMIINPDSHVVEINIEKIITEFEKNSRVAVAGLKILNKEGKKERNVGKFYNAFTFSLFAVGLENTFNVRYSPESRREIDYVSGGFVAFRTETFRKLQGFDESYFMYVEDMDFCYRAHKAGYQVIWIPYGTIRHEGQGSSNKEFAIVNIYKGLITFHHKNKSFLSEQYARNLLSIKAALIIFVSAVLGKKEMLTTYRKALDSIS